MDYVTLGRTGLRVSVLGLGTGGHSRLGQRTGASPQESVAIVQRALDLGVNFIDTAEAYQTEPIVGRGLRGRGRDDVVLSTKKTISREGRLVEPADVVQGLEDSLERLGTDRVEIYHLHGVEADEYEYAREHLVPALLTLREHGKTRWLGITEAFAPDPGHRMLERAVQDDCWDVIMVGFNVLNQSARERVLPHAQARGLGVLNMFAVRQALSRPDKFRQAVAALAEQGAIDVDVGLNPADPVRFLVREGSAYGLPDAAYRFCRAEPGVHVVLSGTGSMRHLEENVASILRPPLPAKDRERLMQLFAGVDTVSGQ